MLKSNPNPENSNRQPRPKNYLKKCHLIGYRVNGRGYKVEISAETFYVKSQFNNQSNQPQHPQQTIHTEKLLKET